MKKSKKYAALMAAAMLLSGTQLAGATTTYLGSGYGNNYTIKGTYENNSNTGDGAVGQFYVYTNGNYDKNAEDKEINSATFENVTFKNNTVTGTGTKADTNSSSGGAAVFVKGSDVTFNDVEFTNNTVSSTTGALAMGGAVLVDGVRNNHNYDATVTFNVSKDMTYSGNTVTGATESAADTYGSVAITSGGFLYLDRGATANFNIADGATLTIGNKGETDPYTDSIASSIKAEGQTYSENAINKTGTGTLTVNGEMKDYHGDLNVKEGTMNINSSLASDSIVSVSSGATLNLKKLALNTSAEKTQTVVKPGGTGATEEITTPEKSGALVVDAGATVIAQEITASDKTSVTVGEGASLSSTSISTSDTATVKVASGAAVAADTISTSGNSTMKVASGATVAADTIAASGDAQITVDSGATVNAKTEGATTEITAGDNVVVSLASGSNVSGNLHLTSEKAQQSAKVLGSFSGTIYGSGDQTLTADTIKSIVGFESESDAVTGKLQINSSEKGDRSVQLSMGDDGTFAIKSYDFSKTDTSGQVQTAELGTWDIDGNYSANTHNISDVGTLSAKTINATSGTFTDLTADTIKLGGVDLQKTLDSKANVDASNIGANLHVGADGKTAATEEEKQANLNAWGAALGTGKIASGLDEYNVKIDTDGSAQLVTGKTVYDELRPTTDGNYVKTANTTAVNLEALDSEVEKLTRMANLDTEGENVIKDLAKGVAQSSVKVEEGINVSIEGTTDSEGAQVYKVNVAANGSIASDNTGLVSGGMVYSALTGKANTSLDNVNDDGWNRVKGYARTEARDAVKVSVSGTGISINENKDTENQTTWEISLNTGTIASAISSDIASAISTTSVSENESKLVTSGAVYTELRPTGTANEYATSSKTTGQSLDALDEQMRKNVSAISKNATNIGTNAANISANADNHKAMKNLNDEGKAVIRGLASEAVTVKGDGNVSVSGGTVDTETGKKTYTISVTTGDVGSDALVTGTTVASAISSAIDKSEGKTTEALETKANLDASNIGNNIRKDEDKDAEENEELATELAAKRKASREAWGAALGTTDVVSGSNQLITSGGLYSEVRLTGSGYHFVSTTNSAAENLAALDGQVFTNQSDISDLKNLSNISKDAKKVIQNANKLIEGNYISVTPSVADADGNITTTISVNVDGKVEENNNGLVTGGAVYKAIETSEAGTDGKLAGKANLDASNIGDKLKGTDGTSDASDADKTQNLNQWGAALGTGKVASGTATDEEGNRVEDKSGQLVTGKTMYDELRPTDGTYVKQDQTTAQNLTALDTQVKKNADDIAGLKDMSNLSDKGKTQVKTLAQDAVQVVGDDETGVKVNRGNVDANGNVTYTVSIDTTTLTGKLGTGEVKADSDKLVTGATVYNAIQEKLGEGQEGSYIGKDATVNANLKALDDAIGEKYGSANNIEEKDDVKTSIGNLDAAIGQVSALKNIKGLPSAVMTSDDDDTTVVGAIQKVDERVGNLNPEAEYNFLDVNESMAGNLEIIDQTFGAVKSLYGETGIKDKNGAVITEDTFNKTGITGVMKTMDEKIGDLDQTKDYNVIDKTGSVNSNLTLIDTKIGITSDGNFVSSKSSVGENLDALDQGLTELDMGLRELDRGLSELGDRVNKVGAGAAALAALHAEAFNPDDKLSFAVGFGHYKNANASAIGAFYKPNEDTTFSIGSTIGNGSTMVNAGISFKLGTSSRVEKTMVAKGDYEALQQKVAAQDEKMAAQDAEIEELKKQVALLVAKG